MAVTIEPLRAQDSAARNALSRLAFGVTDAPDPDRPADRADSVITAYLDDRLAAAATFHEDGQWVGGRSVRMGGVASVAVAPHLRGHGFARAVLRAGLHVMHQRGDAISTLYPTTGSLYRSLGWAYAGSYAWHRIELADLPAAGAADGIDFSPCSWAEAKMFYDTVAPAHNGWLARSDLAWARAQHEHERSVGAHEVYLARRGATPVAILAFNAIRDGQFRFELSASHLVAIDRDAYRAVFAFARSMGSMACALRTRLPEYVLQATLDHGHRVTPIQSHPFMTRIIDARSAIANRGYSLHLDAEVHLRLHDPELPANNGPFVLRVSDGAAILEPGGRALVDVHIADLSAAYLGGTCTIAPLVGVFATAAPPCLIDFF
jgi:predicted acetyltransferase